jgi:Amt family ammonium transporter
MAFMNTQTATATAMLGWLLVEKLRDGRATTLGAASGAVTGLVAITPSCASVTPMGSIVLGLAAGAICAYAVGLKYKLGFDDSLDVVGVHLVGGAVGSILIGFLAAPSSVAGATGILYGGGSDGFILLGKQTVAVLSVAAFSFVVAYGIGKAIDAAIGFRIDEEDEVAGIDQVSHAETAYDLHQGFGGVRTTAPSTASSRIQTAETAESEKERVDA